MSTIVEKSKRPTGIGTDGAKVAMDITNGMTMTNLEIAGLDNGRNTCVHGTIAMDALAVGLDPETLSVVG